MRHDVSDPKGWARRLEPWIVVILGLLVLSCAQIPYIWAWQADRFGRIPGCAFTGAPPTYADEAATYWSWMRQVRDGRFFLVDLYTTEEHPRNYVNLLWWLLGSVCRLTGWSVVAVYSGARVVLGATLIVLLYHLSCRLFTAPGARLAAYLALLLAGGWEGLFRFLGPLPLVPRLSSPAWWTPGISTFFSLMIFPHLLAARIAMLGFVLLMLRAWSPTAAPTGERTRVSLAAGAVLFGLTFFHPFEVVTLVEVLWLSPVLFGFSEGRWHRSDWRPPVMATLVWAPSILYNFIIFRTNPAMRAWDLQNLMPTPSWKRLVIALGPGLLLSAVALLSFRRLGRPLLLMLGWLLSSLASIHLPLRFQYRMIGGINIPLSALAVAALASIGALLLPGRRRGIAEPSGLSDRLGGPCLALTLLMSPIWFATPLYLLHDELANIRKGTYPSWLRTDEVRALSFLEENAPPASVILASYEMGNWIPPFTGRHCVLGHYALSVDARRKREEIKRFFSAGLEDDPWRWDILRRWGVEYLLFTSHERGLGDFEPASRPWLQEVFRAGTDPGKSAAVYAVALPGDPRP